MLITNHVLAGALTGAIAPGPVRAFVAGVASHVVMDTLPHWGDEDMSVFHRVAVVDGLCGLATMAWIARRTPPGRRAVVVAGMLGACFPDTDKPAQLFFSRSPFPAAVDRWHESIQDESPDRMPREVTAAVLAALAVRMLSARRGRTEWDGPDLDSRWARSNPSRKAHYSAPRDHSRPRMPASRAAATAAVREFTPSLG